MPPQPADFIAPPDPFAPSQEVADSDAGPDVCKALRNKFRKTKMCTFHLSGRCRKGSVCNFAHNKEELMPLPDLYRTKLCPAMAKTGCCDDELCRFAHSEDELRGLGLGPLGSEDELNTDDEQEAPMLLPRGPPPSLPREVLLAALEPGSAQVELPIANPDAETEGLLHDGEDSEDLSVQGTAMRQCTDPGPMNGEELGVLENHGFYRQYTEPGPPGRDRGMMEDEALGMGRKYRNLKIKNTFLTVVPEDRSLMPKPRSSPDLFSMYCQSKDDDDDSSAGDVSDVRRILADHIEGSKGFSSGRTSTCNTGSSTTPGAASAAASGSEWEGWPRAEADPGRLGPTISSWGAPGDFGACEDASAAPVTTPPPFPSEPRSSTPPKRHTGVAAMLDAAERETYGQIRPEVAI